MSADFSLVHISDPHFHAVPRRPHQWLSKRALGALNLIYRRAAMHPPERAARLVRRVAELEWEHLVITGDLTQLGLEEEFAIARATLAPLLARGAERVTVLPGNHDRYVAEWSGRDHFMEYFGEFFASGEIATRTLGGPWRLVAWDSAVPTPPLVARGRVRRETLAATEQWLADQGPEARIVLANHYPLHFMPPHRPHHLHDLRDRRGVRDWVADRPIALYLHGHVHQNWVLNVNHHGRAATHVNSASSTRVPRPEDPSAFHRINFSGGTFLVQPLALD